MKAEKLNLQRKMSTLRHVEAFDVVPIAKETVSNGGNDRTESS